ncbi:hypothetical protein ACFX2B_000299 [Malus domestica]
MIVEYFFSMFSSNGDSSCDEILASVHGRVTSEMNHSLCANFSDEEIKETLFQMDPHTASDLDGRSFFFLQNFWDIVDDDVVSAVRSFLTCGCILNQLNYTMVSLILKVVKPHHIA